MNLFHISDPNERREMDANKFQHILQNGFLL